MKVWLDDVRPMPEGFDLHVLTADSAITALRTGKVTLMSFDHDLGEENPSETGYKVAKWVEREAEARTLTRFDWQIHSANPAGRKNIEAALEAADRYWDRGPRGAT